MSSLKLSIQPRKPISALCPSACQSVTINPLGTLQVYTTIRSPHWHHNCHFRENTNIVREGKLNGELGARVEDSNAGKTRKGIIWIRAAFNCN